MGTIRRQICRRLDPADRNVTLSTPQRAAEMLGQKVRLDVVCWGTRGLRRQNPSQNRTPLWDARYRRLYEFHARNRNPHVMDIENVIQEFSAADGVLPVEALRWALDHWDAAAPRFAAHLDDLINGRLTGDPAEQVAFFIFHLCGEKRETSAFPLLCQFLTHRELADSTLGDAITSTLRDILIAAYDGEPRRLQDVIESEAPEEYARGAALEALAYLSFSGATPQLDMHAYMLDLFDNMQPRGTSSVWSTWAIEAAHLGYADFTERVEELLGRGFIDRFVMTQKNFARDLALTLGDPSGGAGFAFDGVGPFTDTIGALSKWYAFSPQRKIEEAKSLLRRATPTLPTKPPAPAARPAAKLAPRVGRNDPCPCGSGKKYKKCCLAA